MSISKASPGLTVLKYLRRSPVKSFYSRVDFNQVWDELAPKLTGFSTNLPFRPIITGALSRLVNLSRLVVWTLHEDEVEILSKNMSQLKILVLMSVQVESIQHLYRLKQLKELTMVISKHTLPQVMQLCKGYFDDFFESETGRQLTHFSFNFKGISPSGCLDSLTRYCTQLKELRIKEVELDEDLTKLSIILTTVVGEGEEVGGQVMMNGVSVGNRIVRPVVLPCLKYFSFCERPDRLTGLLDRSVEQLVLFEENGGVNSKKPEIKSSREGIFEMMVVALFQVSFLLEKISTPFKTYTKVLRQKQ